MQQQMIELECPSCQAVLELDAGFAGGVCRCSNCGTLMTVPADPQMVGESLDRPDRPDTPGASAAFSVAVQESTTSEDDSPSADRPESPQGTGSGSAVLDELVASTRPETPSRQEPSSTPRPTPKKPTQPKHPAPKAAAPAPPRPSTKPTPKPVIVPEIITTATDENGQETFVTASGKKVMLAVNAIPVAKVKRKVVRGGVYALAALVMVAVIGGTVAALIAFSNINTAPTDNGTVNVSRRGYDPNVNPFQSAAANFLGLPLTTETVILVDASSYSRQWLGSVIEAATRTVRYDDPATRIRFVFQTGGSAESYPETPTSLSGFPRAEFDDFLYGVRSSGAGEVTAMVQQALTASPQQIIVVTSQPLSDNAVRTLTQLLDSHSRVRLDLVMINTIATDHSQQLSDLVKAHDGELISLPANRIDTWLTQAGPLSRDDDDVNESGQGDANP